MQTKNNDQLVPHELSPFSDPIQYSTEANEVKVFSQQSSLKTSSIKESLTFETRCAEMQKSSFLDFYRTCSQEMPAYDSTDFQDQAQHSFFLSESLNSHPPPTFPAHPYLPYSQPWSTPATTQITSLPIQHYEPDYSAKYFSSQNSLATVRDKATEDDNIAGSCKYIVCLNRVLIRRKSVLQYWL